MGLFSFTVEVSIIHLSRELKVSLSLSLTHPHTLSLSLTPFSLEDFIFLFFGNLLPFFALRSET